MVSAMKVVVNGYGVFLGTRNGMIYIKTSEAENTIPAGNVDCILVASGGVSISSSLLRFLSENSIDIVVLNSNGSVSGIFRPMLRKANVQVRKEQYSAQNDYRGLYLAKCFVKGKILNQYYLLKSVAKNRRIPLKDIHELKKRADRIELCEKQRDLIQEEAKAAEVYWRMVSNFYNIDRRRKKYDDPDEFNMALNYGYKVLSAYVTLAIDSTNLILLLDFSMRIA
ncbi:MAG: CRISPR-associated endonuclease Cas1 [Archaeoglobus sp.]|nr:MAG: CRISPR-associated endonuclease Cas1 [Archaeoglobus sp.]